MVNDISATLALHEGSYDIIMKIADSLSGAFASTLLEKDDLRQEIFLFCVSALPKYDGRVQLENFLRCHARNQILNVLKYNKRRKVILETVDVDDLKEVLYYEPNDHLESDELFSEIEKELTTGERKTLMKMLDGVPVVSSRRKHVREKVREIIERRAGEDQGMEQSNDSVRDRS